MIYDNLYSNEYIDEYYNHDESNEIVTNHNDFNSDDFRRDICNSIKHYHGTFLLCKYLNQEYRKRLIKVIGNVGGLIVKEPVKSINSNYIYYFKAISTQEAFNKVLGLLQNKHSELSLGHENGPEVAALESLYNKLINADHYFTKGAPKLINITPSLF